MTGPKITITAATGKWVVRAAGAILGESSNALALHEGDYPAVIYFPLDDIAMDFMDHSHLKTTCPHKGQASYFSIAGKSSVLENAAWSYEEPIENVSRIKGMLAFDPNKATIEQV